MRIDDFGTAKCSASNAIAASLARPSRAGQRTQTTYSLSERRSTFSCPA